MEPRSGRAGDLESAPNRPEERRGDCSICDRQVNRDEDGGAEHEQETTESEGAEPGRRSDRVSRVETQVLDGKILIFFTYLSIEIKGITETIEKIIGQMMEIPLESHLNGIL